MGMDVYGKNPKTPAGEYFRNNVWWWRPLAEYVCQVAPAIAQNCQYWQSNDGDGLGARDSIKLAEVLQAEIDAGRTAEYAAAHTARLAAIPREPCRFCESGITTQKIADTYPAYQTHVGKTCIQCGGVGTVESGDAAYPFSVENVQEFIGFLRHCGGFKIC